MKKTKQFFGVKIIPLPSPKRQVEQEKRKFWYRTLLNQTLSFLFLSLMSLTQLQAQWSETAKVLASDAQANDFLGFSSSVSGNYAIVGAGGEDTGGSKTGAVYIFYRNAGVWGQQAKIQASDKQANDEFGWSVSISGDYAIISAPFEDTGGTDAGAAYIFKRSGTTWTQEAKIQASDIQAGDSFGWSVSISGDYAVVGTTLENSAGTAAGAAYIFKRSGTSWNQEAKIQASDIQTGDLFGQSVSISGEYVVIGAHAEDTGGSAAGAAYIFKRSGTSWNQEAKIQASDKQADDFFGRSVSISGDYVIAGAYAEDTGGNNAGAAYIFKRSGTSWNQEEKIQASDIAIEDAFGWAVSISGDYAIVCSVLEDTGGSNAGAVYIFKRSGTSWNQEEKIQASDIQTEDRFGNSVAIDGDYIVIGAHKEDAGGIDAGAAYFFESPCAGIGITTTTLPLATQNATYTQTLTQTGLTSPTWSVLGGNILPAGLSLNSSTGEISGTPTGAGDFYFTIQAQEGTCTATQDYVLSIAQDPTLTEWNEAMKVLAGDTQTNDQFGFAVSISGDYAVVGARHEDTGGSDAGAAYIFKRSGTTWAQEAKIQASDRQANDEFGYAVSISGDYAIVGARYEDTGGSNAGSVYVYHRSGTTWTQQVKIQASDRQAGDEFGFAVSISGDYIIVGARHEDAGGNNAGAAYIFKRSGTSWNQEAKIQASDIQAEDRFGWSVSASGDYVIVGARGEDTGGSNTGAAYIFKRSGTSWTQEAKIQASDKQVEDRFGFDVSISGDYAVAAARFEDTGGSNAGSVYIFKRSGTSWNQEAKIQASDKQAEDYFGQSVSLSGHYLIVGARLEDAGGITDAGTAYIFKRSGTTWNQEAKIQASDKQAGDGVGIAVSISGNYALAGAWTEDAGGSNAGAAYFYKLEAPCASITNTTLPLATQCSTYSQTLAQTGLTTATWSILGGNILPAGLSLNSSTGEISGTPTGAGDFYFTIQATEGTCTATQDYVLNIAQDPTLTEWNEALKALAGDAQAGDNFGWSVAISGDYAIVGANLEDTGGSNAGAAYIFKRSGTTWMQEAKIQASDAQAGDEFGFAVAISGDYAIIGARYEDTGGSNAGAAYIFKRTGTTWTQQAKIQASDKQADDNFGVSVALSGEYAVVGAYLEDTGGSNIGSAYVFKRSGSTWTQEAKIQASDKQAGDNFARSVSISGDYIIADARLEDTGGTNAGAAYIFHRSGTTWIQQAKIQATDIQAEDRFGFFVSISGDYAVAGARNEDTGGTNAGAAYIFKRTGTTWTQEAKIQASDIQAGDNFGRSVDISGDYVVISARLEDTGGTDVGAAYIFKRSGVTWTEQAKIQASDKQAGDDFGIFTAISGNYVITGARLEDAGGTNAGATYFYKLEAPCLANITTTTLPSATQSTAYTHTLAQTGLTSPTWSVVGGNILPAGLSLNASTGEISGTPTGAGDFYFTIQVEEGGCIDTQDYTLSITQDPSLTVWNEASKVLSGDIQAADRFGYSVSISGDYAIVGAYSEDTGGGDAGAAYIFHRSGTTWTEQVKIQASDKEAGDRFGISVSISGDYAIVGAIFEDTGGSNAGAAYIFQRSSSTWTEQAKIQASDKEAGDRFGISVSISGDYAMVGAEREATGGSDAGAAYIFKRSETTWTQQAKIQASDKEAGDRFGISVSISGDYVMVGAVGEDTGGSSAGATYIFHCSGMTWIEQAKIQASDKEVGDQFGISVSISGDYAIVGAVGEDTGGSDAGAAYIFKRSGTTWTEQTKIQASDAEAGDEFSRSVSISGDYAIVGAYREATGGSNAGAAYVFKRSGSTWTEQVKVQANDKEAGDNLGISVAISGNYIVTGAWTEGTGGGNAGAAYFYKLEPSCSAPTAQVTGITMGTPTSSTLILSSFTAPSGGADGYAIYINNSNTFTAPSNGDEPTADLSWNNAGQQAVYFGTSIPSNLSITGLTTDNAYYIRIYAYNDCSGTETYESTGASPDLDQDADGFDIRIDCDDTNASSGTAQITIATLPEASPNVAYSQTLTQTGLSSPTWSVASGTLPTGLNLDSSTGEISGTPTVAASFNFTIEANDGTCTASETYNLLIVSDTPTNIGGWFPNEKVRTIAEDSDYIYLGGEFRSMIKEGTNGVLSTSGNAVDITGVGQAITGFPKVNDNVYSVISDGSGGWYIGGSFTEVGGVTRNRIAHINPDKSLDMTWNPDANGVVFALALSGTDLYVGGSFTNIGGQARNRLAKISTTGTGTATTWNPNVFNGSVNTLLVSGTDLYVGGSFTLIGGQSRNRIAKVSTTSGAVSTWNPSANGIVQTLALSGTDLYVGGTFTNIGGQSRNRLAKISTTTGLADPWNPNINGNEINALALSGSDLYIGGKINNIGGLFLNANLAKISTTTGNADATWNPSLDLNTGAIEVLVLSGTDLYVGGGNSGGPSKVTLAKVSTTTGNVDATWNPITNAAVHTLALAGSELYVGGLFTNIGGETRNYIARIQKSDMELDMTWNPNVDDFVYIIAPSSTSIFVGGEFTTVGALARDHLAKVSKTGAGIVDATWNPNPNNEVRSLILSGTDLYVGGEFTSIDGQSIRGLARVSITGTGTVDATWSPNPSGSGGRVYTLALSGTDLYVGGLFTNIGGEGRNNIAKISTTGTGVADATWNPNASSRVNTFIISGTDLYVGGLFTTIGGEGRNYIAKLSTTGTGIADATWNPNADGFVNSLAFSGTDLYVGGQFTSISGESRNRLARLSIAGTGVADATWNPDANIHVYDLVLSGTDLYVGGWFTNMGGENVQRFAVFSEGVSSGLPITLLDFQAKRSNAEEVLLTWTTASEKDNAGFEIEMSQNARDFQKIGFVAGQGNSNTVFNYQWSVNSSQAGYYRLKQIDIDGTYTYSEIRFVGGVEIETRFSINPNPTSGNVQLHLTNYQGEDLSLQVFSETGQHIWSGKGSLKDLEQGLNRMLLNLPSRLYLIHLNTPNQKFIERLILER